MGEELAAAGRHEAFGELRARRARLSGAVIALVMGVYYGFVLLAAFAPGLLARPVLGAITLGVPLGLAVILFSIGLTGFYAWRANARIDPLVARIAAEARRCG